MENQLKQIYELIKSSDSDQIIRAIRETEKLTEVLALGFFAIIREHLKQHPEIDHVLIEAEIATTNRPGLNPAQVAKELSVHLQSTTQLTEIRFEIIGAMLTALDNEKTLPQLRDRGMIQIAGLAVLIRLDGRPEVKCLLKRGLYNWQGELRSDVSELIQLLPFLDTKIEKYRRRPVFAYPIDVIFDMARSIRMGTAPVGFFIMAVLLSVMASLTVWASQGQDAGEERPKDPAPIIDYSEDKLELLPVSLKDHLLSLSVPEALQKAAVIVMPNRMVCDVVEGLSAAGVGPLFVVGDEFGNCPYGCEWLTPDDLQLLDSQISDGTVVVACFVPTSSGKQQFRLVNLTTREVYVSLTLNNCDLLTIPKTPELLAEANLYMKSGNSARCELALRKAKAAAKTSIELGEFHRQRAWYLRSKSNPDRDQVIDAFRQALLLLPTADANELRAKLPPEAYPFPDTIEVENSMGQATSLPLMKENP